MSDHQPYTDVKFVQLIDGKSFVIRCRHCDGTGRNAARMRNADHKITLFTDSGCGICSGLTMLRLNSPDIPVNCGPCQGTGRRFQSWVSSTDGVCAVESCHDCNGYGIRSLTGKIERIT